MVMSNRAASDDRPRPRLCQGVAQVVARRTWNAEVVGSTPAALTITTRTTGR